MKAKFIKHKNPRDTLGMGILNKRNFNSYEEFIDWIYKYLIPDFYGIPNGPNLYKKIMKTVKKEGSIIPQEIYYYIKDEIIPQVKINGINIRTWDTYNVREKYPFPMDNSDLKNES